MSLTRRRAWLLLAAGLLWTTPGCTITGYLLHAAAGEAKILLSRKSVEETLKRESFGLDKRRKLALIKKTASAAETMLGLKRTNQYREVAHLDDAFNVWVLSLAEPDAMEMVKWSFPIVGEVPYLGFFDQQRALDMAAEHYPDKDRYIRTAAGFSTLGFFPDPVLPAFFAISEESIVNLIVHELVHATLYIPGQSNWNETVASALGDAGASLLLEAWQMPTLQARAEARLADRRRWAGLIERSIGGLRDAYARESDRERRLERKADVIAGFKAEVLAAPWANTAYTRYSDAELNNAFFLANEVYLTNRDFQTAVYRQAVSDFTGTLAFLNCVQDNRADDPWLVPGRDRCD